MATFPSTHSPSQSGQIAVIILLLMVVLMTIGLSLATRTTQELFLSQQQSDKARVFNASEVGIEEALSQDFDSIDAPQSYTPDVDIDDTTVNYDITPADSLETLVTEGVAVHVDLNGQTGSELTIDWGYETGCDAASLVASVYYNDTTSGQNRVRHEAIGPCTRSPDDNFNYDPSTDININSYPYRHRYQLSLSPDDLFVRIRPVYSDTNLNVSGSNLATQIHTIRSTASNENGDEQSVIEVNRTLETAPNFMDYALYTGGALVK